MWESTLGLEDEQLRQASSLRPVSLLVPADSVRANSAPEAMLASVFEH
jgi:hypothetical protein